MKDISKILASFKQENTRYDNYSPFGMGGHDFSRHEEPTRDPDVWPPPTPVEHKSVDTLVLCVCVFFLFIQ